MNKTGLLTLLLVFTFFNLQAEDYEYQYFSKKEKDTYAPFSDYIPLVRLHYQTVPHHLEDYYLLYGLKQYYNENTLRINFIQHQEGLLGFVLEPLKILVI